MYCLLTCRSHSTPYVLTFPTRRSSDLAKEIERVQTNVAQRQRHEIASQRHTAQAWRRRPKMKGPREWTFERQAPRSSSRSEEHTSELQSPCNLVCRLLLEKKKKPLDQI